jgi:hypothetical protein
MEIKSIINETLSGDLKREFCFAIMADFKFKKQQLDKKLDDILNLKIKKIENEIKNSKSKGIILFDNGYIGEVNKQGLPDGRGALLHNTQPDQDIFNGEFKSGLKHGLGKYTYFNRDDKERARHPFEIPYYSGEWFANFTHGIGKKLITQFSNLVSYEGSFTVDKMCGFGTYKQFNSDNQKICNKEYIGYFYDELPYLFTIEINLDDKGNLLNDTEVRSGLLETYPEHKVKIPVLDFNNISEWKNLKPKELDNKFKKMFDDTYRFYFKNDIFSKEYEDLLFSVKKEIMSLMFESNKYFEKNSKNKNYYNFLVDINKINQSIKTLTKCEHLEVCKEYIKDKIQEFSKLKNELNK